MKNCGGQKWNPREMPVFQTVHTRSVRICDIQDSLDSTRGLDKHNTRMYFESCCINYDNVEKYYDIVKVLNTAYYKDRMNLISYVYHYISMFSAIKRLLCIVIRDIVL